MLCKGLKCFLKSSFNNLVNCYTAEVNQKEGSLKMTEHKSLSALTAPNLATWDERADIHFHDKTGFYAIEHFRRGHDIIFPIESNEIGSVKHKKLMHLQCHIGLETLCLARRGADASGLDFSSVSIDRARLLAHETKVQANFYQSNLYNALDIIKERFDIVFSSWGSLNWLPDIWQWAEIIAELLAPQGYLYLIEQHPCIATMREYKGVMAPAFAFRTPIDRPIITDIPTTYNEDVISLVNTRMHEWQHPLSDILGALIKAGLNIEFFHEHERIAWQRFPMLEPAGQRMYKLPMSHVPMPLAFSLKAFKK